MFHVCSLCSKHVFSRGAKQTHWTGCLEAESDNVFVFSCCTACFLFKWVSSRNRYTNWNSPTLEWRGVECRRQGAWNCCLHDSTVWHGLGRWKVSLCSIWLGRILALLHEPVGKLGGTVQSLQMTIKPESPSNITLGELLFSFLLLVSAAIEGSGMGGMKLPVGMTRRALSYDDNLEAPMSTPPHDISINNLWKRPIIPERKFTHLAEVRQGLENTHCCFTIKL